MLEQNSRCSRRSGAKFADAMNTAIALALLTTFLVACSIDKQTDDEGVPPGSATITEKHDVIEQPQPCASDQEEFISGYQNFPGKQCSEIFRTVASSYQTRVGFRRRCQQLTESVQRPASVARVQVNECGPLRNEEGNYASILVCCETPVKERVPAVIAYDIDLDCPDGHVQALAANLHYPNKNCPDAVIAARARLDGAAYKRACTTASGGVDNRPAILDAEVFTCSEQAGAVIDVAVCCSAQLPPGGVMHSLQVPVDIWESLRQSDLLGIQLLLSRRPEQAQVRGERNVTPLHLAGNVAITAALLGEKAEVDAQDVDGASPLHYAVRGRLTDVTTRLLEVGASVDAVTDTGETALFFAPTKAIAELLLAHGANPNAGTAGGPLHTAAFNGRVDVAQVLLAHGALVNSIDRNGETPLHRAVFRQRRDVVALLLREGADVNILSASGRPRTAFDMTDNPEILQLLKASGGVSGNG